MQSLNCFKKKNVLLGVSGSIAAEKTRQLADILLSAGANIKIICTPQAQHFLSESFTAFEVYQDFFTEQYRKMDHIELAKWADLLLIAPASAGIISRCAHATASDLLSLTYLATAATVFFAPAMNQQMWQHPSVKNNVDLLRQAGNVILGPAYGKQACGDIGYGRMLEPVRIITELETFYQQIARGLNVLITAGPTHEKIDPVRYITNYSSGKMGYALAEMFSRYGAKVTLISGPTQLTPPDVTEFITVESAQQMLEQVIKHCNQKNVMVASAAVADYRPYSVAEHKIKKSAESLIFKLVKNPDILQSVKEKYPGLFTVGFALETKDLKENAKTKLQKKHCNLIVANKHSTNNQVFGSDYNQVHIIERDQQMKLPRQTKEQIACEIVKCICQRLFKSV